MARLTDLADELRPLILEGDKLDSALKQKVTIDLDTKEAQKEFQTFEQKLASLKNSVAEMQKSGKDATEAYSKLGQTAAAGIAIIATKFQEVGEQIESITAKILANNERINASGGEKKSGFIKSLEEETAQLQRQLDSRKRLQEEYARERQTISDSFTKGISEGLGDNTANEKHAESLSGFQKAMAEADTSWIFETKMSLEELKATYKDLLEAKKDMEGGKPVNLMSDAELKEYAQVVASLNRIAELMYGGKSESPLSATKDMADPKETEQEFNSLTELKRCIAETKSELESLREKAKSGQIIDVDKSVEEAKTLEAELKRLESMRVALEGKDEKPKQPKQTVKETKSQEQEIQGYMTLKQLIQETVSTQAKLAQSKATLPFSSNIQSTQASIKTLNSHMKELKSVWANIGGGAVVQTFNLIKNSATSLAKTIGSGLKTGVIGAVSALKSLGSGINSIASSAFNGLKSAISMAVGAFNTLKSAISSTIGNMRRMVSGGINVVVKSVGAIKTAFQAVSSQVRSLVKKGTPNLMKSFSSFKSMLMRRIKRTFISSIFNQAKEGLQQLAKSSESFNKSMSNIKNSAKQAAGNLSMVLGNLIQTLEPALMTLLSWFNQVMEAINGLFALLSGKKTVLVAKQNTDDYANSLKQAGGAAKDLNHQLYGFDEITRQEDNNGGGGGGKIEYEEQAIDDALGGINDFFRQMLEAFNQGQFERVGQLIAEQLNNLTTTIDNWVIGLRPKATQWTSNITRIFNGMLDPTLFENLGKLVGDGLNLVFDVANTFLTTFHFDKFGDVVASGINSMFDTVEWDLVGETFANYFNGVWDFIGHFLSELDWAKLGYKLSIGIGSFFENIDWKAYRKMISSGINGVFELLYTFVDGIDWRGIASDIDKNLTELIEKDIDWKGIENALSASIEALLDVFGVIADSNFFTSLAQNVGSMFGGILNNINWSDLVSDILTGLAHLRSAFWTLIGNLDLPSLATKLASAINGLMTDSKVQNAWEQSTKDATSGINSIIEAFSNIVAPPPKGIDFAGISTKIGAEVGSLLNNIDWDVLVSDIATGIGRLTEGFWSLISSIDIPSLALKLSESINGLLDDENVQSAWTSASDKTSEGLNQIITAFDNFVGTIKWKEIMEDLGEKVGNLFKKVNWAKLASSVKTGLTGAVVGFKGLITRIDLPDIGDRLGKALSNIFKPDAKTGKTIFSEAAELVRTALDEVVGGFGKLVDGILKTEVVDGKEINLGGKIAEAFNTLFADSGKDDSLFHNIGDTIGRAISSIINNITTFIYEADWKGMADGLLQMLSTAINNVFSTGGAFDKVKAQQIGESITKGIGDVLTSITDFLGDIDFDKIGKSIGEMLTRIKWLELGEKLLKLLWQGIIDGLELIGGLAETIIKRLLGIPDYEIFDATALEWANQFARSTDEAFQSGTYMERLAKTASLISSGLGEELIKNNQEAEREYSGYAEWTVNAINEAFERTTDSMTVAENLANALDLEDVSDELIAFVQQAEYASEELKDVDILKGIYENAQSAEDLKEYFKSIGLEAPQELIDSLVGSKPGVDKAARQLLDDVQNQTDFEKIKDAFAKQGLEITDSLAKSLTGLGMEDLSAAFYLIGEGIDEYTLACLDRTNLSNNLSQFMTENGTTIKEAVAAMMLATGEDLESVSAYLGKDAGYLLAMAIPEGMVDGISAGKKTIEDAREEFKKSGTLTDEQKEEVGKAGGEAGKKGTEEFASETKEGKEDVVTETENVTSAVEEAYEALPDEVKPHAEALMKYITTALADGDGTVKAAIDAVAQSAVDSAKEILGGDAGIEIAQSFIDGLKNTLSSESSISDVKTSCASLIEGIQSAFQNDATVKGENGEMASFAKELRRIFSEIITEDSGKGLGREYISGIAFGMRDEYNYSLSYEAEEVATGVIDELQWYINRDNGYMISYYIMEGLVEGLMKNKSAVCSWASTVAKSLVSTMEKELGIASPSKVFAQIGVYTMQGLQEGMEASGKDAVSAVADVANAIIDEAENGDQIQMSVNAMTDGLDSVTDKMARLAQIFNDIASTVTEMGGLDVPTVATGKVIPYRAKVDTTVPVGTSSIDETNLEDAIYSAFTRAMGNENNQQPIEVKLVVDGRTLADIVTKKQREQQRAWGV